MKKLKITKRVTDKITKETYEPGTIIEREDARAKQFIDSKNAEEVTESKTLDELAEDVAKINSVEEIDTLAAAEKKDADRKGAADIFEKRKAEITAEAEKANTEKTEAAKASVADTPKAPAKAAKK